MSGDVFGCHICGVGEGGGIREGCWHLEAKDSTHTKGYPAPNTNSIKVEKSCCGRTEAHRDTVLLGMFMGALRKSSIETETQRG